MHFFTKPKSAIVLFLLGASLQVVLATTNYYVNSGIVLNPIVDAYNFTNEAIFHVNVSLPYETSNTTNYVNLGMMDGFVGYRFNTLATPGGRRRAFNFDNQGSIQASTYLLINSTNVLSPGILSVNSSGQLQIQGKKVDIQHGALLAGNSSSSGSFTSFDSITSTNYFNESKVSSFRWGVGTNNVLGAGEGLMPLPFQFGFLPYSGVYEILDSFNFTNNFQVPFYPSSSNAFVAFANTTTVGLNKVIQAVVIYTNFMTDDIAVNVRFAANSGNQLRGRQAIVEFSTSDTDVITGSPSTNAIYFGDNTAAATFAPSTLFYQTEGFFGGPPARPNSYDITLSTPIEWEVAQPPNTVYDVSLLINTNYQDTDVSEVYAAYHAFVGSPSAGDPSTAVGRIEIFTDYLQMDQARLRAEGAILIQATNFQPMSTGTVLDSQQISLNLFTTNQTFLVSNLLAGTVKRVSGDLNAWSAVWTNKNTVTGENIRFHVLLLEPFLDATQVSSAYGFSVHATNQPNGQIILADDLTVSHDLALDADNITIQGILAVPGDLGASNYLRAITFTNEGSISVPGAARFARLTSPFTSFVNRGSIEAVSVAIGASQFFENSGSITSSVGSVNITNTSSVANFNGGRISATTHFNLTASGLQTTDSFISAGSTNGGFTNGSITLNIANVLTNSGSSNIWECTAGFNLLKTTSGSWVGDLLGTKIVSQPWPISPQTHRWTAVDYGPFREGYSNNAALGWLTLDGGTTGKFRFSSPTTNASAIYVDYLEFKRNGTNYDTALLIDPGFTIYFANANLPITKLDGSHTNRLRWVRSFAGPNSSTNVTLRDGRVITVNRALAESATINSDNDLEGPNKLDPYPFDGPKVLIALTNVPSLTARVSWTNAASSIYAVDFSTNLVSWQVLTNLNTGSSVGVVTVPDIVSTNRTRFYRVRYSP